MAYDPKVFNTSPYYDDYDDDKNFLRILYKPGYAVQARELTQAQTITQKQLQRFGDHFFKEGSVVTESQVTVVKGRFLRVGGLTGYDGVKIEDFDGLTASVSGKNIIKISGYDDGLTYSNKDTNPVIFFGEYLNGPTGFSAGDILTASFKGTSISATITGGTAEYNNYNLAPNILPYSGDAAVFGLDNGVRFVKGFFVKHDAQKLIINTVTGSSPNQYRKFNNVNSNIFFEITNTIVTPNEDSSLNDPAYGSYNYAAPGADRYRIDLNIAQNNEGPGTTSEYLLAKIENDLVSYRSNYPEYNVLADELARRTYDESGNYTVDDFQIFVEDLTSDESSLSINIGPGKAYIFGYEFISSVPRSLTASKARETEQHDSLVVTPFVIGNTVDVTKNVSITGPSVYHLINWNGSPLVYLSSGTTGNLRSVGTARLGKYEALEDSTKLHVYDVRINRDSSPTEVKRIFYPGYTAAGQQLFDLTDGELLVMDSTYSSLIFPFSDDITSYAVKNVAEHDYTIQRSTVINTGAGSGSIYLSNFASSTEFDAVTNCEFISNNDVRFLTITGNHLSSVSVTKATNTRLDYSGAPAGITAVVFASINVQETSVGSAYVRDKSLVTETDSVIMRKNGFEAFAYINGKVDVNQIVSITGNIGASSGISLTDYFLLDSGRKDDIYDWSRIVLKREYYSSGVTGVSVTHKRYSRENSCLPYMLTSYGDTASLGLNAGGTGANYKVIPDHRFTSTRGTKVSLGSCLDARPDRITPSPFQGATADPYNYAATGGCHLIAPAFETKWSFYLPRTDKLILTRDKQFKMVTGVAERKAIEPNDLDTAMTLATFRYHPYTEDYSTVDTVLKKNRRYTMRDIGEIDRRVDRLEYYTTLNLLEKEAKSLEIQDPNGLNRYKNGIFVDDFTSRANADYLNADHKCSIDPLKKEARPRFIIKYAGLSLTGAIPSGLTYASNGMALCNYTTNVFLRQPKASKGVNVNPFNVVNFLGTVKLTPSTDDWVDVETRPDLVVNIDNTGGLIEGEEYDIGTVWNNWETTWTGVESRQIGEDKMLKREWVASNPVGQQAVRTWERTELVTTTEQQRRTGTRNFLFAETATRQLGKRVIDVSLIPYMRAVDIQFQGEGFRPNVRLYPFFDRANVSSNISINGTPSTSPLRTDRFGRIGFDQTLVLNVPAGVYRTGDRAFRLIDDPNNIIENSTTNGEAIFGSSGLRRVEEGTTLSIRSLGLRRETVEEEQTLTSTETRVSTYITRAHDPVAQTFFIDPVANPVGVFLKKVDLYFKSKAEDIPVRFELRPTVNGYPQSNAFVTFSQVTLLPDQVNVSEDASVATTVEFQNPIYIQPGEFSMVLLSASNEYEVWVSEMGQNDTISGERITSQPSLGSLFKSQNATTWTAEQLMDLKFTLYKCAFDTSGGTLTFKHEESDFDTQSVGITNGANLWHLNTTALTPSKTGIAYTTEFQSDPANEYPTANQSNLQFPTKKSIKDNSEKTVTVRATFTTETTDISPAIDLERISGLYVQNVINFFNGTDYTRQDGYERLPSVAGVTASDTAAFRYISKRINLQENFESNNVDVFLAARLPQFSEIKVYMRSQAPFDSTPFRDLPFEPMTVHPDYVNKLNDISQYVSVGEDDYIDLRFIRGATGTTGDVLTSGITGQTNFKSFQVKVVMYGDPTNSVTPGFRDFRAIAT